MSSIFPRRSRVDSRADDPRLVDIEDDDADEVFAALSSETAREILSAVYDDPRPASELADVSDTSLQNARYHLDKLVDAGLVEVADTWYSERGTEMKVYAPASESVVLFAGDGGGGSLRETLRALLAATGVIGLGGVAVHWLATRGGGGNRVGYVQTAEPTGAGAETVGGGVPWLLDPGVLFLLGGFVALAVVFGVGLLRERSHRRES